jgi:hypothetical protein
MNRDATIQEEGAAGSFWLPEGPPSDRLLLDVSIVV